MLWPRKEWLFCGNGGRRTLLPGLVARHMRLVFVPKPRTSIPKGPNVFKESSMNTMKKRATGVAASIALAVAVGASGVAATSASAVTSDSTAGSVLVTTSERQALKADASTLDRSEAKSDLKQAAQEAEPNPLAQLLRNVAIALILFVKLFTPAAAYQAMVKALKTSVAAMQRWLNTMPAWMRTFLRDLSPGQIWRTLKSIIGIL